MRLALELAAKGGGKTRPNPMVGAVVVANGRVVGSGYHRRAGGPHAEVVALRQAGARARGATLYVSLEPCAHTGRTPPCVEAVLRSGVRRVVAAMVDPNPLNRGRGIRRLKSRGLQVKAGVLEGAARRLNELFVNRMEKGRPFVTVKMAQSLDGKIATRAGQSRWITGPKARRWVHRLRSEVDAILVGIRTVLKDDPRLTVRSGGVKGAAPLKVILDSKLRTPPKARIFSSCGPVLIAATAAAPRAREKRLVRAGAEVVRLPSRGGRVDLKALLKELAQREISHLLIEGGGETIASAFQARAVDRVAWFISPRIIGGRGAAAPFSNAAPLSNVEVEPIGPDWLVKADVADSRGN